MPPLIDTSQQVKMEIATLNGKVILRFGRPIPQVVLDPDTAMQIGQTLVAAAMDELKKGGLKIS